MGYAAAVAWLMVVPMIALTFVYARFVFRRA
jgi:multiple sugar transport system permease protein